MSADLRTFFILSLSDIWKVWRSENGTTGELIWAWLGWGLITLCLHGLTGGQEVSTDHYSGKLKDIVKERSRAGNAAKRYYSQTFCLTDAGNQAPSSGRFPFNPDCLSDQKEIHHLGLTNKLYVVPTLHMWWSLGLDMTLTSLTLFQVPICLFIPSLRESFAINTVQARYKTQCIHPWRWI